MPATSTSTSVDLNFVTVPAPSQVEPGVADRRITVGSVSKSYAMTGWRVGWMSGPKSIIDTATAVQSHTTSYVSRIAQAAAVAALTGPDVTVDFRDVLCDRLRLCEAMLEPFGLFQAPPDGAFYVFPDVCQFNSDDVMVADRLLSSGVITVPGSSFGAPGHLRLSFAIGDEQLQRGLVSMVKILNGWSN